MHLLVSNFPLVYRSSLEESLSRFHPDMIVYNAGTDILEGDPLGKLSVSPKVCSLIFMLVNQDRMNTCIVFSLQGIINQDKIVFMKARERHIPIVMRTSGGYLKRTANIIARSIINLEQLELINLHWFYSSLWITFFVFSNNIWAIPNFQFSSSIIFCRLLSWSSILWSKN